MTWLTLDVFPDGAGHALAPMAWTNGSSSPATEGDAIRFPAPTRGLYNRYRAIVGRSAADAANLSIVEIIESNVTSTAVQFGDPNHVYSTVVGTTAAIATATSGGGPAGGYALTRSDGLFGMNTPRALGCAVFELSDSLISDYAIRWESNFNAYVVARTCATVTGHEFRSDNPATFWGFEQPVGGVDAHTQFAVLGANPAYSAGPFRMRRKAIATTDANYTLSDTDIPNVILEISGAWSISRNIVAPTVDGARYFLKNTTTGGFAAVIKTSAGTGVTIAANRGAWVYCDGTNYVRETPDATFT